MSGLAASGNGAFVSLGVAGSLMGDAGAGTGAGTAIAAALAFALANAIRSAVRASVFLRWSIRASSSFIFLTKSFTSPAL